MQLLKLINPYYWLAVTVAKFGLRVLLIVGGAALVGFIALDAGAVNLGAMDMLKGLFGW